MKVQPGQSIPANLEQSNVVPNLVPKERVQTLTQAAKKVAIVIIPVMLVVAAAIIAGKYFSSPSNPLPDPITPDPTITVESYKGEKYLCTVSNSCLENLRECVDNLKGRLHYGYGTQEKEDGSYEKILWSSVPQNCIRLLK